MNFPFKLALNSLKTKLLWTMIAVGALPLFLAIGISYIQGNKSLERVIGSSFQALAYETSLKIDFLLAEEIAKNKHLATHPTLVLFTRTQTDRFDQIPPLERENTLARQEKSWSQGDPEADPLLENTGSRILKSFMKGQTLSVQSTRGLFVTDAHGRLIASLNPYPDYRNEGRPFWAKTLQGGEDFIYLGGLVRDPRLEEYVFHLAIPIRYREGDPVGVFHRVYSAKEFFSSFIEPLTFGETGHVMMINSEGVVIACPILPTGTRLTNRALVRAVTGPSADWVETRGNGHGSREQLSIVGFSPLERSNRLTRLSSGLSWFTFAWQDSGELFAPTRNLFFWITAAGVACLFLIAGMGSLASRRIVKPILHLKKAAARIGRGEKIEALNLKTGDEIEELAREIDLMNRMLQQSFSGLEHQVEEKTREVLTLKEYTQRILESVPDVIGVFNRNLEIEYVNSAFLLLTGKQSSEVVGKPLEEIEWDHPDRWHFMASELKKYSRGEHPPLEEWLNHPPPDPSAVRDPLEPSSLEGSDSIERIFTLGPRSFVYQFFDMELHADGTRHIGLMMREVTEERKLRQQLERADKLSGLGTLAAGIAHEMNNPLNSIMGFSEMIQDKKCPPEIKALAGKIFKRSKHMASIILNLTDYSRFDPKDEPAPLHLCEQLDSVVEMALMASFSDDIVLKKNYSPMPPFEAKPEEIQQIFLNIIVNAVQAMEGRGELILSAGMQNGKIEIRIQDSGPGIPKEFLPKIFDPFFTSKTQGKGTGLGLNIVHRLVQKYGGRVDAHSEIGKGTTFVISLPVRP